MANSSGSALAKAEIKVVDGSKSGQVVECMFRPKEYTLTKQNKWEPGKVKGKSVPPLEFKGGGPASLTMELFFDTYEADQDVRKYTNKIWELMAIDSALTDRSTAKGRPPLCQFQWGPVISFKAVITNINQKFTMFKSDGTPIRATLQVTFQEAEESKAYPFQNPTSSSKPGYKVRVVKEGETIDWIAFEEYGDSSLWRHIAETNNLEDPLKIQAGQALSIAPAP
jgi:nucleoid-associated protein YgaU